MILVLFVFLFSIETVFKSTAWFMETTHDTHLNQNPNFKKPERPVCAQALEKKQVKQNGFKNSNGLNFEPVLKCILNTVLKHGEVKLT